jgi:RNA recognition motif-containing protein
VDLFACKIPARENQRNPDHHFFYEETMTAVAPSKTLYVRNLNESVKLPVLKQDLETTFSQFGNVLNVIAHKNLKMRGQAFVVFEDTAAAEAALAQVRGFEYHGKKMDVQFAKTPSDDTVLREQGEDAFEQHKKQRLEVKGSSGDDYANVQNTRKQLKPRTKRRDYKLRNNLFVEQDPLLRSLQHNNTIHRIKSYSYRTYLTRRQRRNSYRYTASLMGLERYVRYRDERALPLWSMIRKVKLVWLE